MPHVLHLLSLLALMWLSGCGGAPPSGTGTTPGTTAGGATTEDPKVNRADVPTPADGPADAGGSDSFELATFGAGCFWCVEAVLARLDGVQSVESGYMGGTVDKPTYDQVCGGATGHAEVCQIRYDPKRISYAQLLDWFWQLHDPTTLDRQGADVGDQYRSAIFYHSDEQRQAAERSKAAAAADFDDPIVTEITPAAAFFEAEDYHQDYYRGNREQGYCRMVIRPKLEKLGLEQ